MSRSAGLSRPTVSDSTPSTISPPAARTRSPSAVSRWRTARPGPGKALEQAAVHHASGELARGLVGLERVHGEIVQGGIGSRGEVAQYVPLLEREPQRGEEAVALAVMAPLQALDGQGEILDRGSHEPSLNQVPCIRVLSKRDVSN